MSRPDVLAVAKLHPFYRQALDSLYTVHDRTHETDPQAFAALAPRIMGVAGTGEALVPEFFQQDVRPPALADALQAALADPVRCARLRERFSTLHGALRRDGAARAAEVVQELLRTRAARSGAV